LIEIYATLPTVNVEIEKGFNCMKRTKINFRNNLSGKPPRSSDDIFDWGRHQNVEARWKGKPLEHD